MKKILLFPVLLLSMLLSNLASYGQMNYTVANTSSTPYDTIVGTPGSVSVFSFGAQNNDDVESASIDLESVSPGLRFILSPGGAANTYRFMGVNTNGYVTFSQTGGWAQHNYSSLSTPSWSLWVNSFNNVKDATAAAPPFTYKPLISAFWDDLTLSGNGTDWRNSQIGYKLTTPSTRVLTIEWYHMQRYPNFTGTGVASFQIILTENPTAGQPSRINIRYKNEGTFGSSITASIGILGTCAGDFYSADNFTTGAVFSRTIETTNLSSFPVSQTDFRFNHSGSAATTGNDDICNAIVLPYNTNSTCNVTVGNTSGTLQAITGLAASCTTAPVNNDVWYKVTIPAGNTSMIVSTDNVQASGSACGTGGVQFQVYSASGAVCPGLPTLAEIACSNNGGILNPLNSTATVSGLTAGATYYIRVSGDAGIAFDFQICVKNATNDSPCGAVDLGTIAVSVPAGIVPATSCVTFNSTTLGATKTRGAAGPSTAYLLSAQGAPNTRFQTLTGTAYAANPDTGIAVGTTPFASPTDVWFKFKTSPTVTDYVIESFGLSLIDAQMALYQGTSLNCAGAIPISSGFYFNTGTISTVNTTFPTFQSCADDVLTGSNNMPRIVATGLSPNTYYYVRFWRKKLAAGAAYPTLANASSVGTTITCTSTLGLAAGSVVRVSAGTGTFVSNPNTVVVSVINSTSFTVSIAPSVALSAATIEVTNQEGSFGICAYERPRCGIIATCNASAPFNPTSYTYNANGNYNATKCSTPLQTFPADTNGRCYKGAPKIPTIGKNFAPLCGDSFTGPWAIVSTASATTTITVYSTANLAVGNKVTVTSGTGAFAAGTTITSIIGATQFVVSAAPTTALGANATISTSEFPANSNVNTFGTVAAAVTTIPFFYRLKNTANGSLTLNFANLLCAFNRGIRVALFLPGGTVPVSPTYDCSATTWTLVPATSIDNIGGIGQPYTLYGNVFSGVAAGYNPNASTGTTNAEKFSMNWANLAPGVYYLMVDGAGSDRCYYDLLITGTAYTNNQILPVKLLNFSGKNVGGINQIKWTTASEQENDFFTLERSFNGDIFESIAVIDGAGNSSNNLNYSYTDKNTSVGLTYYRLKLTDFNKNVTYSEIIGIMSKTGKMIEFTSLHPNPTNQNVYVDLVSFENISISVEIRDISGKLIRQHNASVNQGENQLEVSLEGLEKGLYFVHMHDEKSGDSFTKKVIKQ